MQVWGRDDDIGEFTFSQADIDKIVQMGDNRHPIYSVLANWTSHGTCILSLCVSDLNKQLLLNCDALLPVLVDNLFLDPEHPRRKLGNFDAVAPAVQRVSLCAARPDVLPGN